MRLLRAHLPRSLERRIALLIVVLALAITGLGTSISVLVTRSVLHDSMDEQLRAAISHPHSSAKDLAEELPSGGIVVWKAGAQTQIVAVGPQSTVTPGDRAALERLVMQPAGRVHVTLPDRDDVRGLVQVDANRRALVALSDAQTESNLARLGLLEGAVWILAGLLAVVIGTAGTRRLTRPLRHVATATSEIAETPVGSVADAVTRRVPEGTSRVEEVDAVGRSVNSLLEQVESALRERDESEETLRSFLADVSHELRTPIAVVRSHAELTGRILDEHEAVLAHVWPGNLEPGRTLNAAEVQELIASITALQPSGDQLRPSLERIEREAQRMGRLVDDLLVLARLERGQSVDVEEVDVTFVALEALSDAKLLAPDHHWAFASDDEPAVVRCDEATVRRVVTNLVANARRHTPAGTHVTVAVHERDGGVAVSVTDDGPGLPDDVAASPGRRFGNRDRTNLGSSGLGLAISSALMDSVGGRLTFDSSDAGLLATAWFQRDCASARCCARTRAEQHGSHADEQ